MSISLWLWQTARYHYKTVTYIVVIGLGARVFFSGLIRGAEIIGNNPAVQNVTQEAKEFLDNNIQGRSGSSSSSFLVITTNEARYRVGEPVIITVKNIGDQTLTFPNSAAGLKIQNTNTNTEQMYGVAAAQVTTEWEPGASRTLTWNQEDGNGNNVPAGDYIATVQDISSTSAQSVSAQVSFEITE